VDLRPIRRLQLKVSYRDYWLANVSDGLYNAAGTQIVLNKKATSNHVGQGVDTMAVIAMNGKTSFGIGVGILSPGAYLIQTKKTSGFVYPYLMFTRQL
jgi:hypothetical protein